jgi:hypothetical protein
VQKLAHVAGIAAWCTPAGKGAGAAASRPGPNPNHNHNHNQNQNQNQNQNHNLLDHDHDHDHDHDYDYDYELELSSCRGGGVIAEPAVVFLVIAEAKLAAGGEQPVIADVDAMEPNRKIPTEFGEDPSDSSFHENLA